MDLQKRSFQSQQRQRRVRLQLASCTTNVFLFSRWKEGSFYEGKRSGELPKADKNILDGLQQRDRWSSEPGSRKEQRGYWQSK